MPHRGRGAGSAAVAGTMLAFVLGGVVLTACGVVPAPAAPAPTSTGDAGTSSNATRTPRAGAGVGDTPEPAGGRQSPTPTPGTSGPGVIRLPSGRVYVLANPQPVATQPRPLLVVLHSFGSDWRRLERAGRFTALARREGIVVVYGVGRDASWNAGSCCGWAQSREEDDVGYLVDLVRDVRRRVPDVDPARVYLVGFSNGAMMTLRALCERPDVFAAGVGVAGQLVTSCAGGGPVRYLEIHGTADATVPFLGGEVGWLGLSFSPVPELPRRIRAQAPGSVVELTVHRCGHVWPNEETCRVDASEAGWRFLKQFRRQR